MGWSSGSAVFGEIIEYLQDLIEDDDLRKDIYLGLIQIFEEKADCDTLYECKGEDDAFDEAFDELYPEEEEEVDGWESIEEEPYED